MSTPTAVVFPGQGTQIPGMGSVWSGTPEWDTVVGRAESVLGEGVGRLLIDADAAELSRTRNAQLAVLLTSLLAWEAIKSAVAPVAFAGHSLGQVTALIASGALDFDAGVRFAAIRADRTQAAADARPGVMAALLGATLEHAFIGCAAAPDACWIANDNADGQVVLAGTPEGLEAGVAAAKAAGARTARPLAVGGAFHTPLMQPAVEALRDDLSTVTFRTSAAPIVSNADGLAYGADASADDWRERSAVHVATTVRWRSVQPTLVALGATQLYEVGHGSMLAALAKRTIAGVQVVSVATPADAAGVVT
ncbi:MAG: ACP S-malonyltransferase [Acidimicrobiia bacterium]